VKRQTILTQYEKPKDKGEEVKKQREKYGQGYFDKFTDKPSAPTAFKKGDIVQFTGGEYVSADAAKAANTRPASRCKVTQTASSGKYPLHLVSEDGGKVFGWVAAVHVSAIEQTPTGAGSHYAVHGQGR
jgi:hypothetical protein